MRSVGLPAKAAMTALLAAAIASGAAPLAAASSGSGDSGSGITGSATGSASGSADAAVQVNYGLCRFASDTVNLILPFGPVFICPPPPA